MRDHIISLSDIERHIPRRLWPAWGVLVAPVRLWEWCSTGSWCWTIDGEREPLWYRWSIACAIWHGRYWCREM